MEYLGLLGVSPTFPNLGNDHRFISEGILSLLV